jgi:hypothetical protein
MKRVIPHYLIIVCPQCGLVQYIKEGQKSRKCPNSRCRKMINPRCVIVYGHTPDIHEAVRMVQQIKEINVEISSIKEIHPILEREEDYEQV